MSRWLVVPGALPLSTVMSSGATLPLEPLSRLPRKFGRYALFDFIGKGGMAEIFLARAHTELLGAARLCVVKQILPSTRRSPSSPTCSSTRRSSRRA